MAGSPSKKGSPAWRRGVERARAQAVALLKRIGPKPDQLTDEGNCSGSSRRICSVWWRISTSISRKSPARDHHRARRSTQRGVAVQGVRGDWSPVPPPGRPLTVRLIHRSSFRLAERRLGWRRSPRRMSDSGRFPRIRLPPAGAEVPTTDDAQPKFRGLRLRSRSI